MNEKLVGGLMLLLAMLLIGGVIGWYLKPCPKIPPTTDVRIQTDTITHTITQPPIYVKGKAVVRYVHDTTFVHDTTAQPTQAFVATLDTVADGDTINARYEYPQHTFSVLLKQKPDSVRIEQQTIYITKTDIVKREWYIDALGIVGSFAVGYGVGRVTQ